MRENIIQVKSFDFSVRIFKLYKYLSKEKKEYKIAKQILRSGTSIAANIEEAIGSQSKKEFLTKISISYRESRETRYWLHLIKAVELIEENIYESLLEDCEQIIKILAKLAQQSLKN
jgi:four helix bundle protein